MNDDRKLRPPGEYISVKHHYAYGDGPTPLERVALDQAENAHCVRRYPGPMKSPDFETYHTIAFDRDYMLKLIGTGTPIFDGAEFLRFERGVRPAGGWPRVHDDCTLQLGVWFGFVPEVYRADVERGAAEVGERFKKEKIDDKLVPRFVDELRRWIGENVEPQ
jgi:hypothetical protein